MNKLQFNSSTSYLVIGEMDLEEISKDLKISKEDSLIINELTIEANRQAIKWLNIKPYNSTVKLLAIKNVEKMSNVVANALLKTLEEPPTYALIMLTSENEKNILPTINSRCIKYRNYINKSDFETEFPKVSGFREQSLKERFAWVNEFVTNNDKSEIAKILLAWQKELREEMLTGKDAIANLKKLAKAKELTLTNISLKLLLENLVMDF